MSYESLSHIRAGSEFDIKQINKSDERGGTQVSNNFSKTKFGEKIHIKPKKK
jgi:hypothetical protein